MYTKKIIEMTDEELYQTGGGRLHKLLFNMGLSDDNCYVLLPSAFQSFLNSGEKMPTEIEKDIIDVVHKIEINISKETTLGEYIGDKDYGHFLSLKLTVVSRGYHEVLNLPVFLNVGVGMDTLLSAGSCCEDKSVLWVRDCYYHFLKSYLFFCKDLPLPLLMEVERGYNSKDLNGIVERINKLFDWYKGKYGELFVNVQENASYECVVNIVKNIFKKYSQEIVYGNAKCYPCSFIIEPMRYGNKDSCSGSGIVEVLPNSMIREKQSNSATIYKGVFYPGMLTINNDKAWNESYQTKNEYEVRFPEEKDNWYEKAVTHQLRIISSNILDYEMTQFSRIDDKEYMQKIDSEIAGIRIFYIVESGKIYVQGYSLIPTQEIIDKAKKEQEQARREDLKRKAESLKECKTESNITESAKNDAKNAELFEGTSDITEDEFEFNPDEIDF